MRLYTSRHGHIGRKAIRFVRNLPQLDDPGVLPLPAHYEPCGPRFALVFRYVTKGQQTALKSDAEGRAEWAAANLNATGAHAGK